MGLQFMKKQDKPNRTPVTSFDSTESATVVAADDLTQCISDMYQACGSAISILNDLLLFDRQSLLFDHQGQ